jgi:putative sigma-54 modulation protein
MEHSQPLKDYGIDKISKLEKYLDGVMDAEITFTIEKFRHRTAVVLSADGLKIKAEQESEDMYSSVDLVVDKLEKQIKRHREKLKDHKAGGAGLRDFPQDSDFDDEEPPLDEPEGRPAFSSGGNGHADSAPISRVLDLPLTRMSQEEAAFRLSGSSLPFLVYLDAEDGGVRLIRHSGSGALELARFHRQAD